MKKGIHPEYHGKVKISCSCGNSFETGSTAKKLEVEVCSACHPFYTGKSKLVDTAGRVDKFQARLKKVKKKQRKAPSKGKQTSQKGAKKSDKVVKIG